MNKKLFQAAIEHEKFLKKYGVHPSQLKNKKEKLMIDIPNYKVYNKYNLSNGFAKIPGKNGVMENRFKETNEVRNEIEAKSKRIAPLWNKGGTMYITPDADLTTLGKKI